MSITALESAIVAAGNALVTSAFGVHLRSVNPGQRMVGESMRLRWLAAFESSLAPAVRRTLVVLESSRLTGRDLDLDAADLDYIQWVKSVHAFLQAAVDRFWLGIGPDLRMAFVDHDDLPPLPYTSSYIPALRVAHAPDLDTSSRAIGLAEAELSSLSRMWRAARRTPAFDAALAQATYLRRRDGIRTRMLQLRGLVVTEGRTTQGPSFDDEQERLRRLGDSAYDSAAPEIRTIAKALRDYNELVQHCLALVLGAAERAHQTQPIRLSEEAIQADRDGRHFRIRITSGVADPGDFEFAAPFLIDDGGPLDGVYLTTFWRGQLVGRTMIFDVEGVRTREFEGIN